LTFASGVNPVSALTARLVVHPGTIQLIRLMARLAVEDFLAEQELPHEENDKKDVVPVSLKSGNKNWRGTHD
jgi:hypothetical protein